MAKDFAFMFCPGDYLRDTQCLSEKAQVAYDRIMCEHIRNVSKHMLEIWIAPEKVSFFAKRLNDDERSELYHVLKKNDAENGGFQIEWVAEKVAERQRYIESRQSNGSYEKHKKAYAKLPESENEIEVKSDLSEKERKSAKTEKMPFKSSEAAIEVITYLNHVTGRKFNPQRQQTTKYIDYCLRDGYSIEDLKKIVDSKFAKWGNDEKMRQYLRPETLFAAGKIESYLQDANDKPISSQKSKQDAGKQGFERDRA